MTSAEVILLSLVVEQPRYGYEIEHVIRERGWRAWAEVAFSSIYFVLRRLEQRGWVQGRLVARRGPGPTRRIYRATPAGRKAWQAALQDLLSGAGPAISPFCIGASQLDSLRPAAAIEALKRRRSFLVQQRRALRRLVGRPATKTRPVSHVDDLRLTLLDAELTWTRRLIRRLARRCPAVEEDRGKR